MKILKVLYLIANFMLLALLVIALGIFLLIYIDRYSLDGLVFFNGLLTLLTFATLPLEFFLFRKIKAKGDKVEWKIVMATVFLIFRGAATGIVLLWALLSAIPPAR
jgi:hypothetical protein